MMEVLYNCDKLENLSPVVTMGTFDGVHRGHQIILNKLIQKARQLKQASMVLTFWPHPRLVVSSGAYEIKLLNSLNEKIRLIESYGVDYLLILPFTESFSKLTSLEFIEQILHKKINARAMVVGYDHRFGSDRQGDFDVLKADTGRFNIEVERVNEFQLEKLHISSTQIRLALSEGDMAKANFLLGYHYTLNGVIVAGHKNGRRIGFPTANLSIDEHYKLIPRDGVYAAYAISNNRNFKAMLNIGHRPTLENGENRSIEIHLFNFSADLYDQQLTIEPIQYLRAEKKFENINKLSSQLQLDKIKALEVL